MRNFCPTFLSENVFEIDYENLYNLGKRIILFDLDNTLISYFETVPDEKLINLGKSLIDMGFKTYVFTNNHEARLKTFCMSFPHYKDNYHMNKPFGSKMKKYLLTEGITDLSSVIMIGDQLVTDIICANRVGVDSILIRSISRKSEHLYTRVNRLREKGIVKRIAKVNSSFASQISNIIIKEK